MTLKCTTPPNLKNVQHFVGASSSNCSPVSDAHSPVWPRYSCINFKTDGPYHSDYVAVAVDIILRDTWFPHNEDQALTKNQGTVVLGLYIFEWEIRREDGNRAGQLEKKDILNKALTIKVPRMDI